MVFSTLSPFFWCVKSTLYKHVLLKLANITTPYLSHVICYAVLRVLLYLLNFNAQSASFDFDTTVWSSSLRICIQQTNLTNNSNTVPDDFLLSRCLPCPSILDTEADYDELLTGQRREGQLTLLNTWVGGWWLGYQCWKCFVRSWWGFVSFGEAISYEYILRLWYWWLMLATQILSIA